MKPRMAAAFAVCPLASAGLVTAPALPVEPWAQLGVAGLSLFVLLWVMTRTLPSLIRENNASHERAARTNARATIAGIRSINSRVEDMTNEVKENSARQLDILTKHLSQK